MRMFKFAMVAVLAGAIGCGSQQAQENRQVGNAKVDADFPPASFFEMKDYRGQTVDLRDYKGKVVVLNFWATWCGPCRYEIPHLVELRKGFDADEVAIIGVSLDQGEAEQIRPLLAQFIDHYGINYPIVLDNRFELIGQFYKRDLSTLGVPMTYVIDQQGQIYRTHTGLPPDASGKPNPGKVLGEEIQTLLDRT